MIKENKHSAFKALTLLERIQYCSPNETGFDTKLYGRWLNEAPYLGDEEKLLSRLKEENIKPKEFSSAFSSQCFMGDSHPEHDGNDWWNQLFTCFEHSLSDESELPPILDERVQSGGLLLLFRPLINEAYNTLKTTLAERFLVRQTARSLSDSNASSAANISSFSIDNIAESYYQDLVTKLATISGRTLVLEMQVAKVLKQLKGDTSEARFQDFVNSLKDPQKRHKLMTEYPVLFRLVNTVVQQWRDFGVTLFSHLCDDWDEIERVLHTGDKLGALESIKVGAGDTHKQGRSVAILHFSSGFKVVYKPRSLAVEANFNHLLHWCNKHLQAVQMKTLKILDKSEYGWVEFVEYCACDTQEALARFYYRQGVLLALMYVLEGNDFHYENVIACGEHPVVVDLETLFHPYLEHIDNDYHTSATFPIKQTVLRTGLLPRRMWTENSEAGIDLSAMGESDAQLTPQEVLSVKHSGTDEMTFVREKVAIEAANNRPSLNGVPAKAWQFSKEVSAGFEACYRLLMAHKEALLTESGPLCVFRHNEVRVILRETRIYASYLSESLHPDLMRNGLERDLFFEKLWGAVESQPYLKQVVKYERQELANLDIPFFTTRPASRHLWTSEGECLPNFFHTPAMSRCQHLIQRLSEDDLNRQQWLIQASLYASELTEKDSIKPRYELGHSTQPLNAKALVAESEQLAAHLSRLAFEGELGANWFIWKPLSSKHWAVESMSATLYDGLTGTVLYLAYLAKITHQNEHKVLAEKALNTAREMWQAQPETIDDIGMFSGWAGIIYTLTHLSQLWEDESLLDEAIFLCRHIEARLQDDAFYDVIGGAAGTVIVLLNLYELCPQKSILALAIRCGQHILSHGRKTKHGLGWQLSIAGEEPLAGMSHGGAGIALALSKLGAITQQKAFIQAAEKAISHENMLYSTAQGNWPDLREGNRPEGADVCDDGQCFLTAWCHGAPGIGLARLAMAEQLDSSVIQADIERALAATRSHGFHDNHSLCHGVLGNLELLLQVGLAQSNAQLIEEVNEVVSQAVSAAQTSGWKTGLMFNLETPGFMVGLSGIGYQLLRFAYPDKVPSVLSMQGPIPSVSASVKEAVMEGLNS